MVDFVRADHSLIAIDRIRSIDTSNIERLEIVIHHDDGHDVASEANALEGRRLRWAKHAWAIHNLVGHPLLQICAWAGQVKLGLKIHDATVPRPRTKVR
jgi:hypothetical protein